MKYKKLFSEIQDKDENPIFPDFLFLKKMLMILTPIIKICRRLKEKNFYMGYFYNQKSRYLIKLKSLKILERNEILNQMGSKISEEINFRFKKYEEVNKPLILLSQYLKYELYLDLNRQEKEKARGYLAEIISFETEEDLVDSKFEKNRQ